MSSFVFCLIFIQVSVFFIAGILAFSSLYYALRGTRQRAVVSARCVSRNRFRARRTTPAVTAVFAPDGGQA